MPAIKTGKKTEKYTTEFKPESVTLQASILRKAPSALM